MVAGGFAPTSYYYAIRVGRYKIIEHAPFGDDVARGSGGDWSGTDPSSAKERGEVIKRGFSGDDLKANSWLVHKQPVVCFKNCL